LSLEGDPRSKSLTDHIRGGESKELDPEVVDETRANSAWNPEDHTFDATTVCFIFSSSLKQEIREKEEATAVDPSQINGSGKQ